MSRAPGRGEDRIKKASKALLLNNPERIRSALRDLAEEPGAEAASVLVKAFRHRFWSVRKQAHEVLSEYGAVALDALTRSLSTDNEDELYWSIRTLGRIGSAGTESLLSMLRSSDTDRRLFAVRAAENSEDPALVGGLVERLEDQVWTVRSEAADTLTRLADRMPVVVALQAALASRKENTTYWALRVLGRLAGKEAMGPLMSILNRTEDTMRYSALSAVVDFDDDLAVPLLIACLDDHSWIVRKQAAELLLARGERVEAFLKSAFKDGSHDVKFWSIKVLAKVSGAGKMETFRNLLNSGREDLKYYGITALGEVADAEAVELLLGCLKEPSWGIRQYTSEILAGLGEVALPWLTEAASAGDDDTRYWSIQTLSRMGLRGERALAECLRSPDRATRLNAVAALRGDAGPVLLDAVMGRLDDPDWKIRKKASEYLGHLGGRGVKVLLPALSSDNENLQYWARRTLESMPRAALLDLLNMVDEASPEMRRKILAFVDHLEASILDVLLSGPPDELRSRIVSFDPASVARVAAASGAEAGAFAPGGLAAGNQGAEPAGGGGGDVEDLQSYLRGGGDPGSMDVTQIAFQPSAGIGPMERLSALLTQVSQVSGSDLHINVGAPPCIRVNGQLKPVHRQGSLTGKDTEEMLLSILNPAQRRRLEENWTLDTSYDLPDVARFRVNLFQQRRGLNGVFRLIPNHIAGLDDLGLPPVFRDLTRLKQGLILITGPTGSGKSTTLAAMIDAINRERHEHIITIEDPIEFVHEHQLCLISQREISQHTHSFASALRAALREDPDIILVGEMRDLETISLAITASETGHLVFATLHTTNAGQTIDRMIDVFPAAQQGQIRAQLSNSIQAVIAQRLLPRADRQGRLAVHEVLLRTPAMANLIREGKTEQVYSVIQISREMGMQTFDDDLVERVRAGEVSYEIAQEFAHDKKTFEASCQEALKKSQLKKK